MTPEQHQQHLADRGVRIGTTLGTKTCPECGSKVAIKIAKNGGAFFKCGAIIDDDGETCGADRYYGRRATRDLVDEMTAAEKPAPKKKEAAADDFLGG